MTIATDVHRSVQGGSRQPSLLTRRDAKRRDKCNGCLKLTVEDVAVGDRSGLIDGRDALKMAQGRRGPMPGLTHYSGRSVQYAGSEYRALLGDAKIIQSMSRTGHCLGFQLVRAIVLIEPADLSKTQIASM